MQVGSDATRRGGVRLWMFRTYLTADEGFEAYDVRVFRRTDLPEWPWAGG